MSPAIEGAKSAEPQPALRALPAADRPFDYTPTHTDDLPATPTRDRNIASTSWIEAPDRLLSLGRDLDHDIASYKRRIHGWLLWRAGPAKGPARYLAIDSTDLETHFEFELFGDKTGSGKGPSGLTHTRFRAWKEDIRDHRVN